jgi:hypothetical protein
MKAAVGRVCDVARPFDLVRMDEFQTCSDVCRDGNRGFFFEGRKARRNSCHTDAAGAEGLVGHGEHERAVDAPGVADKDAAEFADGGSQAVESRTELRSHVGEIAGP